MAEFSKNSSLVGVALECNVVRVATVVSGELQLSEFAWDPNAPESTVDLIRSAAGGAQNIALSVGLGFLEIAKPELPPLSREDLQRVLRRDTDRFFPIDGAAAISIPTRAGIAFATRGELLHRWVRALESFGKVRAIVPSPAAIEKALAFGMRSPSSTAASTLVADAAVDEFGVLQIKDGVVIEVRRIPCVIGLEAQSGALMLDEGAIGVGATEVSSQNASAKKSGTPARYAAAIGVRELADIPASEMLLDASLQQTIDGRRTRRQWVSYAMLAASIMLLLAAASSRRTQTLIATEHAVDSLTQVAAPGIALQKQLSQLTEESRLLSSHNEASHDPLSVVATLSKSLPADAFVERLAWDGSEWRLDGSANQAASVVPHLDSAQTFTDVRVLSASTRFRDGARMRESFSVGFKVKGDSGVRR